LGVARGWCLRRRGIGEGLFFGVSGTFIHQKLDHLDIKLRNKRKQRRRRGEYRKLERNLEKRKSKTTPKS
jgi:hypothetical protein